MCSKLTWELCQCHLCTGVSSQPPWTVFLTWVFLLRLLWAILYIMRLEAPQGLGLILWSPSYTTGPLTFTPRPTNCSQPFSIDRSWPAGNCPSSSVYSQRSYHRAVWPPWFGPFRFYTNKSSLLGTNSQGPAMQGQSTTTYLTQTWLLSELQPLLTSVAHWSRNVFSQDGFLSSLFSWVLLNLSLFFF